MILSSVLVDLPAHKKGGRPMPIVEAESGLNKQPNDKPAGAAFLAFCNVDDFVAVKAP